MGLMRYFRKKSPISMLARFAFPARLMCYFRKKSPWLLHFDTGGCNGCSIEVIVALTPRFDMERFGMMVRGNPRHADILVVTGPVTRQCRDRLIRIYEQMPDPKMVVGVGSCPATNGVFDGCYGVAGPLDKHMPVDVYVPGCPPKPEAIIHALLVAQKNLREKNGCCRV